jgi:hypothetical protein
MLKKDDPTEQLVYYQVTTLSLHVKSTLLTLDQAGIGTYTSSVLKTPIIESVTKLRDKMVARNLGDHVKGLSPPSSHPAISP